MLLRKDRRRAKRYTVLWDGLLDASFPDFHGQMPVTVADFSEYGALLNSKQIFLNSRHLIDVKHCPELNLKIFSPEGTLESPVEIRWYNWSVEKNLFEIGVEFISFSKESKGIIHRIIQRLRSHHIYDLQIFKNLFSHKMEN